MSRTAVHFDLSDVLSLHEQELFQAKAKLAGRKPAQHFRALLLGELSARGPQVGSRRASGVEAEPAGEPEPELVPPVESDPEPDANPEPIPKPAPEPGG